MITFWAAMQFGVRRWCIFIIRIEKLFLLTGLTGLKLFLLMLRKILSSPNPLPADT